jgi:hypothetical protein
MVVDGDGGMERAALGVEGLRSSRCRGNLHRGEGIQEAGVVISESSLHVAVAVGGGGGDAAAGAGGAAGAAAGGSRSGQGELDLQGTVRAGVAGKKAGEVHGPAITVSLCRP